MNSVQGYKGFITFAIIALIIITAIVGMNVYKGTTDTRTEASEEEEAPTLEELFPVEEPPQEEVEVEESLPRYNPIYNESEEDFEGITPVISKEQGSPSFDDETDFTGILGTQTSLLDEMIIKEFQEAKENEDLNYDFNHDGTVSVADYPLFLEFIKNKED